MKWWDDLTAWLEANTALAIVATILVCVLAAIALRAWSAPPHPQLLAGGAAQLPGPAAPLAAPPPGGQAAAVAEGGELDDIQAKLDSVFDEKTRQASEARKRLVTLYTQTIEAKKAQITKASSELATLEKNYNDALDKMK